MRQWGGENLAKWNIASLKVPGCVLSQQLIPFLYFSEHAHYMPPCAPPAGPPRSLFLSAWPAQQWLSIDWLQNMLSHAHTNAHTHKHTYTHTSFCSIHLVAWLSPFPWFSLSFDYLCPLIWGFLDIFRFMQSLFPPWLKATLKLWGKTKRLMQFCVFFLCSYPGPLTLTRSSVIILLSC